MDGSLSLAQTAMPILAVRLGATSIALGTISWVAQLVRLPICFTSGRLSERVGRKTLILPAAFAISCAYLLFARAQSTAHIMILYTVALAAIGAFYPALQALIGDVSRQGQLTRNLGAFNIGWCVGGGAAALAAGALIKFGLGFAFHVAAASSFVAGVLVVAWGSGKSNGRDDANEPTAAPTEDTGPLLLVSRLGLFTAFFGYATVRILFPKVAISTLGWSEQSVAWTVSALPVGQACGMLATTAAPWWRGKVWPQVAAQTAMLVCGATIWKASSPVILGPAFFGIGVSLSVAYTAALYHGLSSRVDKGKNAGIHEAVVAAAGITGSLLGGVLAQVVSPRAPYVALGCLAAACLVTTGLLCRNKGSVPFLRA